MRADSQVTMQPLPDANLAHLVACHAGKARTLAALTVRAARAKRVVTKVILANIAAAVTSL